MYMYMHCSCQCVVCDYSGNPCRHVVTVTLVFLPVFTAAGNVSKLGLAKDRKATHSHTNFVLITQLA